MNIGKKAVIPGRYDTSMGSTKSSLQNKFALDYASSQQIRIKMSTIRGSMKESLKHPLTSKSEKKIVKKVIQLNETSKLADKYQSIPFFKEMMVRHRYSHSKFDEILSHFAYLLKISSLYDDITKEKIIVNVFE